MSEQSMIQQTLEMMRRYQLQQEQARAQQQQAAAPINTQFANPGQSFGQVMTDGTGAQRQAMIGMGAEMSRDSSRVPGAAFASGAAKGFDILNNIRANQRQAGMEQANQAYTGLAEEAQGARGWLNSASQLQLAENDRLRAMQPKPEEKEKDIQLYEYAVQNGYKGSFYDWMNREANQRKKAAEEEAAREAALTEEMKLSAANGTLQTAQITLGNIDKAMEQSKGLFATGLPGQVLQDMGGTDAHNLKATITQIISTIGFDRLQRMRTESPTGGALGQVSQMELNQLNSALGSLMVSQDDDQLRENLQTVKEVYTKILGEMNSYIESKRPKTDQDDLEARLAEYP